MQFKSFNWLSHHGIYQQLLPFGAKCPWTLGSLRKPRRQRHRERRETKDLMSRTMAVHVRYNSWYISSPSPEKQQREMTKFCVVRRT